MFTIIFSLFYSIRKVSGAEPCSKQRSWLSGISSCPSKNSIGEVSHTSLEACNSVTGLGVIS